MANHRNLKVYFKKKINELDKFKIVGSGLLLGWNEEKFGLDITNLNNGFCLKLDIDERLLNRKMIDEQFEYINNWIEFNIEHKKQKLMDVKRYEQVGNSHN